MPRAVVAILGEGGGEGSEGQQQHLGRGRLELGLGLGLGFGLGFGLWLGRQQHVEHDEQREVEAYTDGGVGVVVTALEQVVQPAATPLA